MKLCLVGKYPPIEGGVSASTYWIARSLAGLGHEIHVVTNAGEVEDDYRTGFEPDDWPWYEPEFPESGGRVRVHQIQPFDQRTMRHIPQNNPVVSRLAGLAAETVRAFACDAVFGYYYEPYAVAAAMAARWTGRPLAVKHAGSDLDRLFLVPDLAATYTEVLRSADQVLTRDALAPRFLAMGVRAERIRSDVPFRVPKEIFFPGSTPAGVPTIGVYGKTGPAKGTYDLIAALGVLAGEGREFRLLAMVGEPQGDRLRPALEQAGIAAMTTVLPLVPHWRVPEFIRSCTAVCFLERDFPIAIHGPVVPREVVACGTCLVLSGEIAARQGDPGDLATGRNVLVVPDPRDRAGLADALRSVITQPDRAREIGRRGHHELFQDDDDPADFGRAWELLLTDLVSGVPGPGVPARDLLAPGLLAILQKKLPAAVAEPGPAGDPVDAALAFCDRVERRSGSLGEHERARLQAALAYQRARLNAGRDDGPPFTVQDRGANGDPSRVRPVRSGRARIAEFRYDVSPVFSRGPDEAPADLDEVPAGPMIVLFHRSADRSLVELRITATIRDLVLLADGTRTIGDLVRTTAAGLGVTPAAVEDAVRNTLGQLRDAGVIVFGDYRPGWGWAGGTFGGDGDRVVTT